MMDYIRDLLYCFWVLSLGGAGATKTAHVAFPSEESGRKYTGCSTRDIARMAIATKSAFAFKRLPHAHTFSGLPIVP